FQKNSLVHVEFTSTNFSNVSLKNLKGLYNLKYLRFENCEGILLDQCEVLKFTSFKLIELPLKCNNWIVDVTSLMIKYLGASLQRLSVDNPTIPLIENVLMFCSKLICLKIRINNHFDLSVLPFFKNLRIRILNINFTLNNLNNFNEFFKNLVNNIPINISNISIYINSRNSTRSIIRFYEYIRFREFKAFLENSHNDFKIINLNYIIELEFKNFWYVGIRQRV
ncbi:hypothetical protein C1646_767889, partial [Rhizophagus diaphanus]